MLKEMMEDLNEFRVLADMIDEYEDEIPADLQVSVNNFVRKFADRTDEFVELLRKLQSFIGIEKEEIAKRQAKVKSLEHYINILRDTAKLLIEEGVPFKGNIHTVRLVEREKYDWDRANFSSIPLEYWKSEPKINKTKIIKDIESGILSDSLVPKVKDKTLYIR